MRVPNQLFPILPCFPYRYALAVFLSLIHEQSTLQMITVFSNLSCFWRYLNGNDKEKSGVKCIKYIVKLLKNAKGCDQNTGFFGTRVRTRKFVPRVVQGTAVITLLPRRLQALPVGQDYFDLLLNSSVFLLRTAKTIGLLSHIAFLSIQPAKEDVVSVFTDGSVHLKNAGCGIFAGIGSRLNCSVRILEDVGSNTAEKLAVIIALKRIKEFGMDTKPVVIYTDCQGLLKELASLEVTRRKKKRAPKLLQPLFDHMTVFLEKILKLGELTKEAVYKVKIALAVFHGCLRQLKRELGSENMLGDYGRLSEIIKKARKTLMKKEKREELEVFSKIETIINASRNLSTRSQSLITANKFHTHAIYQLAASCSKGVHFVFTPAHMDVAQNELADVLAKLAVYHESGKRTLLESLDMCWEHNRDRSEASFSKTKKKLEKTTMTTVQIPTMEIRADIPDRIVNPEIMCLDTSGIDVMLIRYSQKLKTLEIRRMFCLLDAQKDTFRWSSFPLGRELFVH